MKLSESPNVEELQARIAELEAKLAKATRPEPAVGQVWRRPSGLEYMILQREDRTYQKLYDDGDLVVDYQEASQCVGPQDTYRGKFVGFRIEEDGE